MESGDGGLQCVVVIAGTVTLKTHLRRERAWGLAGRKRDAFRKQHGKLLCEDCGLDPSEVYGEEIGESVIEVHHASLMVANMAENHRTKLDDLKCLCGNCHPRSIHPQYEGDALNPAFCSDLSSLVEASGADLWIHGKTHRRFDYRVGSTRVICNPKGYGPRRTGGPIENTAFSPRLVVEV